MAQIESAPRVDIILYRYTNGSRVKTEVTGCGYVTYQAGQRAAMGVRLRGIHCQKLLY